jgi:hypothetical protein
MGPAIPSPNVGLTLPRHSPLSRLTRLSSSPSQDKSIRGTDTFVHVSLYDAPNVYCVSHLDHALSPGDQEVVELVIGPRSCPTEVGEKSLKLFTPSPVRVNRKRH